MSYLTSVTQANPETFYFVREGESVAFDDITAKTITLTEGNNAVNVLNTSVPGGSGQFQILDKASGTLRWAIGEYDAEAGGNSGSNLAIYSYNDTGNFLSAPFAINRATGDIITDNLTSNGVITATNIPAVPVLAAQTALVANAQQQPINIAAGVNTTNIGAPITVPKTGLYILSGAFTYDGAAGDGITFGSADFLAVRLDAGIAGTSHGVNVNLRNCLGNNDGVSTATLVVPLVAGVSYQPMAIMYNVSGVSAITGTPVYGAAYSLTALC